MRANGCIRELVDNYCRKQQDVAPVPFLRANGA